MLKYKEGYHIKKVREFQRRSRGMRSTPGNGEEVAPGSGGIYRGSRGALQGLYRGYGKIWHFCFGGLQVHFYFQLKNGRGQKLHRNIKIHGD